MEVIRMACPPNSTVGICDIMAESGSGLGEFANGLLSGGAFLKLIFVLAIIGAVIALIYAVVFVVKKAVAGTGHRRY